MTHDERRRRVVAGSGVVGARRGRQPLEPAAAGDSGEDDEEFDEPQPAKTAAPRVRLVWGQQTGRAASRSG